MMGKKSMSAWRRLFAFSGIFTGIFVFFVAAAPSHAGAVLVNFDRCWSSCENVGVENSNTIVATLEITQDGSDVDFRLTNLVGNLGGAADDGTIISLVELYYAGDDITSDAQLGTVTGGSTPNSFTFHVGGKIDASVLFNIELDLPPSPGNGPTLFTDGEVIEWTIFGVDLADFLLSPAGYDTIGVVHLQRLSNGESVKYIDLPPTTSIPEPGTLFMVAFGLLTVGLLRRRAVARSR